ncbi:hypothetical protein L1987_55958 [Smallanthus sonchifolius]|uniref:Uncharacterized protein n=1 Tax=Smallanthus sonchifolius TaxID=185202 RepID=A0ACB9EB26_9ASTR|nr:hypothetical protein L1987_55958 [Smallanthus sonchifolius]
MSPRLNSLLISDESAVINPDAASKPLCPLCRGDVSGWIVINDARVILNEKVRWVERVIAVREDMLLASMIIRFSCGC